MPPIYWRTGDIKKTLVEAGIDRNSGAVCKLTGTSLRGIKSSLPREALFSISEVREGIPCTNIFDLKEKTRVDVEQKVIALLTDNRFTVLFGESIPVAGKSLRCGPVVFLISEQDMLCGIAFADFSDEQVENLRFSTGEPA